MNMQLTREHAELIAIRALAFLAADANRLERFLALSGLAPGDIREASRRPGFFAGVLHHIMADDRIALAFASEESLTPVELEAAATALGAVGYERDLP
jgi:Protein of unknown function (DUF3572)